MNGIVRSLAVGLTVLGCAVGWARDVREGPAEVEKKVPDEQRVAEGNNAFALDLYAKLKAEEGNLFFSPFSISTALAMTYAGARANTEAQMAKVLKFPWELLTVPGDLADVGEYVKLRQDKLHQAFKKLIENLNARQEQDAYELTVANALWGQKGYPWLPDFLKLTQQNYGAGLREVNFAEADQRVGRRGDEREDQGPHPEGRPERDDAARPDQRHLLQGRLGLPVRQETHRRCAVHAGRWQEGPGRHDAPQG
jgi:serine protease inhibitor